MIHHRKGKEESEVGAEGETCALEEIESQTPGAKENLSDPLALPFSCSTQLVRDRKSFWLSFYCPRIFWGERNRGRRNLAIENDIIIYY